MNNIINLSDFSNEEKSLYIWDVTGINDLGELVNFVDSSASFELVLLNEIKGAFNSQTTSLIEKNDDDKEYLTYNTSINFFTNDDVDTKKFYLYTFENKNNTVKEIYYATSFDILEDTESQKLTTISLQNLNILKNYYFNKINFTFNQEATKKEINKIKLKFNNLTPLQYLNFYDENRNLIKPKFNNLTNLLIIPTFLNPIYISRTSILFQDDFIKKIIDTNIINYLNKNNDFNNLNLNDLFESDELELLAKCIYVTAVLQSGYSILTEEQTQNFKSKIFAGNDAGKYCDYQINNFISKIIASDSNFLKIDRIKSWIFILSNYIKSSYCLKGGLSDEIYLSSPFFINIIGDFAGGVSHIIKNCEWKINSSFYDFKNKKINFKEETQNNFLTPILTSVINQKITKPLMEKLEEKNYSNSPVDFNTSQSLNFNYFFNILVNDSNDIDIFKAEKEDIKYIKKIKSVNFNMDKLLSAKAQELLEIEKNDDGSFTFNKWNFENAFWSFKRANIDLFDELILNKPYDNFLICAWLFAKHGGVYNTLNDKAKYIDNKNITEFFKRHNWSFINYVEKFLLHNNYVSSFTEINFNDIVFNIENWFYETKTTKSFLRGLNKNYYGSVRNETPDLFYNIFDFSTAPRKTIGAGERQRNIYEYDNSKAKFKISFDIPFLVKERSEQNKNKTSFIFSNFKEYKNTYLLNNFKNNKIELEFTFETPPTFLEISQLFNNDIEISINETNEFIKYNLNNKNNILKPKTLIKI